MQTMINYNLENTTKDSFDLLEKVLGHESSHLVALVALVDGNVRQPQTGGFGGRVEHANWHGLVLTLHGEGTHRAKMMLVEVRTIDSAGPC